MTPLDIAHDVIIIAKAIYDQVQLVESNRRSWSNLVQTIRIVTSSLEGLDKLPEQQNFVLSLNKLHEVIGEIQSFLQKMCKMPYFLRFARAGRHSSKLNDYKTELLQLIPLLQLGLQAQSLLDREQDRIAEQQDRLAFLEIEEKRLRTEQARHIQVQRDLENMIQKQMAAFRDQLDRNYTVPGDSEPTFSTVPASDTESPLEEEFIVKLYEVLFEKKLVSSPSGDIYHGQWKNRPVLIKFVEGSFNERERQLFINEAKLMLTIRHDYIVPFYGACFEPSRMCIVTGRVENLLVERFSVLTWPQRCVIAHQLATGLQYLHQRHMTHHNIHPRNVGITLLNDAKWIDLSCVKTDLWSMASLGVSGEDQLATVWQAPETREASSTTASDVYSFGWLLWTLYTAQLPFSSDTVFMKVDREVKFEAIPSDCPASLASIIQRCWSLTPETRPEIPEIIQVLAEVNETTQKTGEEHYALGKEAEQNRRLDIAFAHYQEAAHLQYYKSYNSLGTFALLGKNGHVKDVKHAQKYFLRGAESGHAPAMFNLGRLYEKGEYFCVESESDRIGDLEQALAWYERAMQSDPTEPRYAGKVRLLRERFKVQETAATTADSSR